MNGTIANRRQQLAYKCHILRALEQTTKIIVIFIEKYLRDYKNSHIFVLKD
jgi:hypothetical protein